MIKITQNVDKKEYFLCNLYYLRRYLGIRELIVSTLLLAIGIVLFVSFKNVLFLILFGVTVLLFLLAFGLFLVTGKMGYKRDFLETKITKQEFLFGKQEVTVNSYDDKDVLVLTDIHPYEKLEKVVIKRHKVYIYAQVAIFYYIMADNVKEVTNSDFADFLHENIDSRKFKIKTTVRAYPKKSKITKNTIFNENNNDKK